MLPLGYSNQLIYLACWTFVSLGLETLVAMNMIFNRHDYAIMMMVMNMMMRDLEMTIVAMMMMIMMLIAIRKGSGFRSG